MMSFTEAQGEEFAMTGVPDELTVAPSAGPLQISGVRVHLHNLQSFI